MVDNVFKLRAGSLNRTWDTGCKCHLKAAAGLHIDRCSLGPGLLAATLRCHELERATIAEQLRKRTSLSGQQRYASLSHLFGPCSSSSAASTRGCPEKGVAQNLKIPDSAARLHGGLVRGLVRGLCGACAGISQPRGQYPGFPGPASLHQMQLSAHWSEA